MLNPNASAFAYAYNVRKSPLMEAQERVNQCQVHYKDQKIILHVLTEWFSSSTLDNVLEKWEKHNKQDKNVNHQQAEPLTFILYNVQGFNSRSLEVLDLIHQMNASFDICTEVG